jgi:hypothetical protein
MTERYSPPSDFLCSVINEEVTLTGSDFAEANLARLIGLLDDENVANRDWATFLLSQLELDRLDVREALIRAGDDPEAIVRSEAILGLVQLDRALALPLIRRELEADVICYPILEAAEIAADPSLIDSLAAIVDPSEEPHFYDQALSALEACKRGQ